MHIMSELFFNSEALIFMLIPFLITLILPCDVHDKKFNWGIILGCLALVFVWIALYLLGNRLPVLSFLALIFAPICFGAFLGRLLRLGLTAALSRVKNKERKN